MEGKPNRQKPLILEGTGEIKYKLRVGIDFEAYNTHPLLLEITLPAGKVYQIDAGYTYVAPETVKYWYRVQQLYPLP